MDAAKRGFSALAADPSYEPVVPFYLLQIEFNEGNYRYVVTTGGSLIDRAAGERRTELERIVAEGWFHLGDYGRTEEFLDAYRRSGGEMGRNENYLLGYSLYRQARYDEARPCLQQVCGADDALTQAHVIEATPGPATSDRAEVRCVVSLHMVKHGVRPTAAIVDVEQRPAARQERGFVLVWPAKGETRWQTAKRLRVAEEELHPAGKGAVLAFRR